MPQVVDMELLVEDMERQAEDTELLAVVTVPQVVDLAVAAGTLPWGLLE